MTGWLVVTNEKEDQDIWALTGLNALDKKKKKNTSKKNVSHITGKKNEKILIPREKKAGKIQVQ